MADIRRTVGRALRGADVRPITLEALHRRRSSKRRNQRIAAGGVALLVAVLAVGGAIRALHPFGGSPPGSERIVPWPNQTWVAEEDGRSLTLLVIGTEDGRYEVTLSDPASTHCADVGASVVGIGTLESDARMTVRWPEATCSFEPSADLGASWTLVLDREAERLTDPSGGVWLPLGDHRIDPPGPADVLWPQTSVEEARDAARRARAGDRDVAWQLDGGRRNDDGQLLAIRFAEERLGWDARYLFGGNCAFWDSPDLPGGVCSPVIWTVVRCEAVRNERYPGACASDEGDVYEAIDVTVSQPGGGGVHGLWVVSGWVPSSFRQAVPVSRAEVEQLLTGYLEARLAGSGAEPYLVDFFGDERSWVYAAHSGSPYVRYQIGRLGLPRWPAGQVWPEVRLVARDGSVVVERYFIGHDEVSTGVLSEVFFQRKRFPAGGAA
jgi:hypothetical protein